MIMVLIYSTYILLIIGTKNTNTSSNSKNSKVSTSFSDETKLYTNLQTTCVDYLTKFINIDGSETIHILSEKDKELFQNFFCIAEEKMEKHHKMISGIFSRCLLNIYGLRSNDWSFKFISYYYFLDNDNNTEPLDILYNIVCKLNKDKTAKATAINSYLKSSKNRKKEIDEFLEELSNKFAKDYVSNKDKKPNINDIINDIEQNNIGKDTMLVYHLIVQKINTNPLIIGTVQEVAAALTYVFSSLARNISYDSKKKRCVYADKEIPEHVSTSVTLLYFAVNIYDMIKEEEIKIIRKKITFILKRICILHGTKEKTITMYNNVISYIFDIDRSNLWKEMSEESLVILGRYLFLCCFYDPEYIETINKKINHFNPGDTLENNKDEKNVKQSYKHMFDFNCFSDFILNLV